MNTSNKSRSVFNLTICLLVLAAACIYYKVAMSVDPLMLSSYSPMLVFGGALVALVISSMMLGAIGKVPIQLIGFVIIPVVLGVIASPFMSQVAPDTIREAGILTLLCIGIMMVASVLFPDFFKRIIGVLIISLIVVILASLISVFVFNVQLTILSYISVVIFMGFLGYDFVKAREVPASLTWAISLSGMIFIDISNIFVQLISIIED